MALDKPRSLIDAGAVKGSVSDLNQRSRDIFRAIVETYLETGSPVGSRTLSKQGAITLSPASIRNVMADLTDLGLLAAPHTSAGRIPTETGLRLFVDGLLEIGDLTSDEQRVIEAEIASRQDGRKFENVLEEASNLLSGLSHCASLVVVPPEAETAADEPLRHIEFVHIGPGQALVVLVTESGRVDNKLISIPLGLPQSALREASNFVNAHVIGRSIRQARTAIAEEIKRKQAELDTLTSKVVDDGLAQWAGDDRSNTPLSPSQATLIVRGQANLLENVTALEDLERVRQLFADLESEKGMLDILGLAQDADGVRIFIGSESQQFSLSGSSVIVSPYRDKNQSIVGVIGVIGPTRLNYGRIIPMVDYTAKLIGSLMR